MPSKAKTLIWLKKKLFRSQMTDMSAPNKPKQSPEWSPASSVKKSDSGLQDREQLWAAG